MSISLQTKGGVAWSCIPIYHLHTQDMNGLATICAAQVFGGRCILDTSLVPRPSLSFLLLLFRCDRRLDEGGLRTRLSDTSSVIDLHYQTHHHSDWFVNRLYYTEHLWSKTDYDSRDNLRALSPNSNHAHGQHQAGREESKKGEGGWEGGEQERGRVRRANWCSE